MTESSKPVYLVGTRHRFQGWQKILCFTPKHQLDEFKAFLQKTIHDYGILSVAEEMSIQALTKYSRPDMPPRKSIPCLAAEELDRPHKYCDPDSARCRELNITDNDTDEDRKKREAEWLAQLAPFASFPCLFVLGSTHTSSFSDLLKASGFKPILLEQEWWPTNCTQ